MDYLCFGVHYLLGPDGKETYIKNLPPQKKWLDSYTDAYVDVLKSGLFLFGVYPDLSGISTRSGTRKPSSAPEGYSLVQLNSTYHLK